VKKNRDEKTDSNHFVKVRNIFVLFISGLASSKNVLGEMDIEMDFNEFFELSYIMIEAKEFEFRFQIDMLLVI
jgi:hypothetical protein